MSVFLQQTERSFEHQHWHAFLTGVLDPEELSLVNRTFRKPFEEPKPSSNKKPALTSKLLNPSAISKLNFSPIRFQKPPIQAESRHHNGALGSSPVNNTGNASKRADLHNYGVKGLPFFFSFSSRVSIRIALPTVCHLKCSKELTPHSFRVRCKQTWCRWFLPGTS